MDVIRDSAPSQRRGPWSGLVHYYNCGVQQHLVGNEERGHVIWRPCFPLIFLSVHHDASSTTLPTHCRFKQAGIPFVALP